MTKHGSNARKRAARELAETQHIPYTEALKRAGQPAQSSGLSVPTRTSFATLVGHTAPVRSLAFHPDGGHLATGSADTTARLWDIETQETLAMYVGNAPIMSVVFSPDGEFVLVAAWDGSVSRWEPSSGETTTIIDTGSRIGAIAVSPDGGTLATSEAHPPPSREMVVRLWDPTTAEVIGTLVRPDGYGFGLAFHPDATQLAVSGDPSGAVLLWNPTTEQTTALTGHTGGVNTVAFSPDGTLLAAGSVDFTVKVWSMQTHQVLATFSPRTHYVQSIAISPNGTILAGSGVDPTAWLWNLETEQQIGRLSGHTDRVACLAFSPTDVLASGSDDRTVRLWHTT